MFIDFEKCFDMIEHNAIKVHFIKRYFNFGENVTLWTMLLFNDFEMCTQDNGYMSIWFKTTWETHQGCNISPFLYLVCGQVMVYLLENDSQIQGLDIYGIKNLLAQFVDDTNLCLKFDKITLEAVINILEVVRNNIGLKVNYDKTSLYHIRSLSKSDAIIYTAKAFKWLNDTFEMLSITISNDTEMLATLNYNITIQKAKNILKSWVH